MKFSQALPFTIKFNVTNTSEFLVYVNGPFSTCYPNVVEGSGKTFSEALDIAVENLIPILEETEQ